ncbi:HNH endonuclease signature motif containing protein [Paenibacillus dokdonensis]|uniref:HNH endonuclease signature motif containing protein n=1 Tax=Paenibacillus dokdonensis TaxID=2567944 RepID=A0ABU6GUJ7_9BACL|nr:HNH endonuclease signature motif containing protein [Paenibacillus dokdonensis]MEC0242006.1 HNH endonuclease signature motif containing protein [Paenibacillus dokdonensis]
MSHQTFWKPEKKEKKTYSGLGQRKKEKKPVPDWKHGILSHHQSRPNTKDRGEFPRSIVEELISEAGGKCQCCKTNSDTTTHHVYPRGRKGRGVKTNGLRLCWPCHDRIQTNEELLQFWISAYRDKYGEWFWFDEQDWEEFNRKQDVVKAAEADKAERLEQIMPVVDLLSAAAGRSLKAKEMRLLECFDDKEMTIFINMIRDVVGAETVKHEVPFGYGHFDD